MNWWQYVNEQTGQTKAEVSRRTGIRKATITRWDTHDITPNIQTVLDIADEFGLSRVQALVAAGYLDAEDASHFPAVSAPISTVTNEQLMEELSRRLHVAQPAPAPPLLAAADDSTDPGVAEWYASQSRGEESQDPQ